MSSTLRALFTVRHALSLAVVMVAIAAGAFALLRAEANLDLHSVNADVTVFGNDGFGNLGSALATGDINGDTIADLVVGAPDADGTAPTAFRAGKTYVFYGGTGLPGGINAPGADVTVIGGALNDALGRSVVAGDINGDTTDDLIIGATGADSPGGTSAGAAYVFYGGGSLPATIDLGSSAADLTVFGDNAFDSLGSVAAGDINGDTMDDLIIGATGADPGGIDGAGATYVIYGGGSLPATIDLDSVSADVIVPGLDAFDFSGGAVAAGDINGDTTDDLIIGVSGADPVTGTNAGETYVIYGGNSLPAIASADLTVFGVDGSDFSGSAVASGDVDGDTRDDLIIGAPNSGSRIGEAYVIYGSGFLPATIMLANADLTVLGSERDRAGTSVSAGDVDGDTTDDLIIGAPSASPPSRFRAGEAYVIYGSGSLPATIDLGANEADLVIQGENNDDIFGTSVGVGDIDGDTIDDVLIGAPRASAPSTNAGKTYVVFGGPRPGPKPTPTSTHTPVPTPTPCGSPGPTCTPKPTLTPTVTPTPCGVPGPTCTPTPSPTKLANGGNLSGVFDVQIHPNDARFHLYHCIARLDHDSGSDEVKAAAQCYSDTPGQEAPGSVLLPDKFVDTLGPAPPPPYTDYAPTKLNGSYDSGSDTLTMTGCFANVGGTTGPNMIAEITIIGAKAGLASSVLTGTVDLFEGESIAACDGKTPKGVPDAELSVNLYRIASLDKTPDAVGAAASPLRPSGLPGETSTDYDGDGCNDADELDKQRLTKLCGDDPYNPRDSDEDFTSTLTVLMTLRRADACQGGLPAGQAPLGCDGQPDAAIVGGSYLRCQAVLDHDLNTNDLIGRIYCYTDDPTITVNIEDNGGHAGCVPFGTGNPDLCGDGLPGAPPPGAGAGVSTVGISMGDVDATHVALTGRYDKGTNELLLEGCYDNVENPLQGPNFYFQATIDAHTGQGAVDVWFNRVDCTKPGESPDAAGAPIQIAEQEDDFDLDQDGCSTRQELGSSQFSGGLRDPFSKFDKQDLNKDGFTGIPDDILPLASQFGSVPPGTQGDVGPRMAGSNLWNHRTGDGVINIPDDIIGVALMFGHNCP